MATLIINATEKCNANCTYCYTQQRQNKNTSMTFETLEWIFNRANEFLIECPNETIEFLWHGGEPLLLGTNFFRRIIELEISICRSTRDHISHSIQTNLTLLTDEFLGILIQLGIKTVGTSLDPEPQIRGIGEKIDSTTYNKMFMKALGLLEREGIDWVIIYVITKKALSNPLGVFFYLTNMALTGLINLNPVLIEDEKRKDIAITPEEYVNFMGEIFPIWWKNQDRYPSVQPFKGLVDSIIKGYGDDENMEFGVCGSKFHQLTVNPDGELSQSGISSNLEAPKYGNIREKSLRKILFNGEMNRFKKRIEEMRTKDCIGCRFIQLCNPRLDEFTGEKANSLIHKSEWCKSRIGFIENYFEPITGVKYEPTRL